MIEWVVLSASVTALVSVLVSVFFGRWLFYATFRLTREVTFKQTLKDWGYTEREIDRAVEEQGWEA